MKSNQQSHTPETQRRMIAEAAYLRAERRGFTGGDPVEDWLSAETEIEKSLKALSETELQTHELAAYKWMRQRITTILIDTHDKLNAETVTRVLRKVNNDLKETREFLPAAIDRASKTIKREIEGTVESLGRRWESFSERGTALVEAWKGKQADLLNKASGALGDWVGRPRRKDKKPR